MGSYFTGGVVSYNGGYRYHTFTASGTLTFVDVDGALSIDYIVVGGGGGGGATRGGGGGAGGVLAATGYSLDASQTITVGAGGRGENNDGIEASENGENSSLGSIAIAIGGGGGGNTSARASSGADGGSGGGGGGGSTTSGGDPTSGQGYAGGGGVNAGAADPSGGGGGATGAGADATSTKGGDGGPGYTWLDGNTYGGGGGGIRCSIADPSFQGAGGTGGGGDGDARGDGITNAATPNTGGGGGGAATYRGSGSEIGGTGGSGIVIVRYLDPGNVIATDDFNRANEQLDASANWTQIPFLADGNQIVSNTVVGKSSTDVGDYWTTPFSTTDGAVWVEVDVVVNSAPDYDAVGPVLLNSSADDFLQFAIYEQGATGEYLLWHYNGGAWTQYAATSHSGTYVNETLRMEYHPDVGTYGTVYCYSDGVEVIAWAMTSGVHTALDLNTETTFTYAGLQHYDNGAAGGIQNFAIDNFSAGDWTAPAGPVTTEFPGTTLPAGWTFRQNGTSNATLVVADGYATVTIPAGVTSDGIFSTGSADNACGLVHAVSGDFDIAFRMASPISGDESSDVGFVLTGASEDEKLRYSIYGGDDRLNHYGYVRTGGSGSNFQSAIRLDDWFFGGPSWLRARRFGSVYTFFGSTDGVTWTQTSVAIIAALDAETIRLNVGQYGLKIGKPIRFDAVVDIGAAGTTDCRTALPTLYEVNTEATDLSTLPAWLTTEALVDGSAVHTTGKVSLSTATADGSSGRLVYDGSGARDGGAGLLVNVRIPAANTNSWAAVGLGILDGGGNIDVYSKSPLFGIEVKMSTSYPLQPIRVHRPANPDAFDEPYTFLDGPTTFANGLDSAGGVWLRVERFGAYGRMKWWADGSAEPGTWNVFDGEDPQLMAGAGDLVPYVSVGHNPTLAASGTLEVLSLEFYGLSETPFAEISAPVLSLVSKDADQVDLSWTASPGATGYDIERNGVVIVSNHPTTTYSDTGLAPSTEYTHRVGAVNAGGA